MKSNGLKRTGSTIVFGLISAVILLWTASLTTSFLRAALPGQFWAVPYLGLVVFDGGMIGWLIVYLYNAEGSMQRTIALGLTIFNLLGVGLMTIAEIVLGGQTLTVAPDMLGTAAIWGIGLWTIANVAAIVGYHLASPDARIAAAIQEEKDALVDAALDDLRNRRQANAAALSGQMGGAMYRELVAALGTGEDGIPGKEHQPAAAPAPARSITPATPIGDLLADAPHANGTAANFTPRPGGR